MPACGGRATRFGSPSMSSRHSGLSSSSTAPRSEGGNASNHRHATSWSVLSRWASGSWRTPGYRAPCAHRCRRRSSAPAASCARRARSGSGRSRGCRARRRRTGRRGGRNATRGGSRTRLRDRPADVAGLPCANGPANGSVAVTAVPHGCVRNRFGSPSVCPVPCRIGVACVLNPSAVAGRIAGVGQRGRMAAHRRSQRADSQVSDLGGGLPRRVCPECGARSQRAVGDDQDAWTCEFSLVGHPL